MPTAYEQYERDLFAEQITKQIAEEHEIDPAAISVTWHDLTLTSDPTVHYTGTVGIAADGWIEATFGFWSDPSRSHWKLRKQS